MATPPTLSASPSQTTTVIDLTEEVPEVLPTATVTTSSSVKCSTVTTTNFRIQAKSLFLTYPQCATSKEDVRDNLMMTFPNLKWYIIAMENHKDGTPHLHVAFENRDKMTLNGKVGMKMLNSLVASELLPQGKHGDYSAMKSLRGTVEYLIKDNNYLVHNLDIAALQKKKASRDSDLKEVVQKLVKGANPKEIMNDHPYTYLQKRRHILEFHSDMLLQKKFKKSTKKLTLIRLQDGMVKSSSEERLISWLNTNLTSGLPRNFKQSQLWLYGPSNIGKSTIINNLYNFFRIYPIPSEDYYCEWDDEGYDLAVLDEYCGSKTIGFLNQWLEGGVLPLKQKNKPSYMKRFNVPTIICSNLNPCEVYKNCTEVQKTALLNRLELVYTNDRIQLEYIEELEINNS